jgi:putative nucleotidyltransferase with HDIG domain
MTGATVVHNPVRAFTDVFPALRDIRDADLRARVAAVWEEAMRIGNAGRGWTIEELRALPFTLLAGAIEMRFVEHLNSCAAQCKAIAGVLRDTFGDRVPVDLDVLLAGALLADVGKLLEFEMDPVRGLIQGAAGRLLRHPFTGVALCFKHGLPDAVMHIVAAHSHEGDRVHRSIECIIFHHADFVDFDIARLLGRHAEGA